MLRLIHVCRLTIGQSYVHIGYVRLIPAYTISGRTSITDAFIQHRPSGDQLRFHRCPTSCLHHVTSRHDTSRYGASSEWRLFSSAWDGVDVEVDAGVKLRHYVFSPGAVHTTHAYTSARTHTCMRTHIRMHAYTSARTHTCMRTHIRMHAGTYANNISK